MSDASPFYGASEGVTDPVLLPQNHPNKGFSEGVGSPQVLSHPDGRKFLLFTGWEGAGVRDLYAADIDNDAGLTLSNYRKVLDHTTYGSVQGAYGFYDRMSDEWVVGMTTGGSSGLHLLALDGNVTTVNSHESYSYETRDSGATAIGAQNGGLYLSAIFADGTWRLPKIQADYSTRPFSSTLSLNTIAEESPWWHLDVHHTQLTNAGLMSTIETRESGDANWECRAAFCGDLSAKPDNAAMFVSERPLFSAGLQSGQGQFGHPHFTTELGRPLIFFDWFRNLTTQDQSTFRHEIWVTEPQYDVQTPHEWFPMKARVPSGQVMATHGAGAAKLVYTTSASDTVTVEGAGGAAEFTNGNVFDVTANASVDKGTLSPSSSGTYQAVIRNPPPAMRWSASNVNAMDVQLVD